MDDSILKTTISEYKMLLAQDNFADALPLVCQAANWGDVGSQILAADMYRNGRKGIEPQPDREYEYTRLAAINGDTASMVHWARLFPAARKKDREAAFYFLKKAAEQNEPAAYDPLAMLYLTGSGCEKDLKKARMWIEKAQEAFPDDQTILKHKKLIGKSLHKSR